VKIIRRSGPARPPLEAAIKEGRVVGKVGWFPGAVYEDGMPVAQVAAFNEYGTTRMPPRPFMRPTIEAQREQWREQTAHLAKLVVEGKLTQEQAMELLADAASVDVVKSIKAVSEPAHAASTTANRRRRGVEHDDLLRDTGTMIDNLRHSVERQ